MSDGPSPQKTVRCAPIRRLVQTFPSITIRFGRIAVLQYALIFLVVAIIAGVLGFTGIAGASAGIAKILFLIFIVLFVISFIFGRRRNP
jgi:uncharacterized membrane protein YtjA (UPF0391 family)